jgi:hypothetical protein
MQVFESTYLGRLGQEPKPVYRGYASKNVEVRTRSKSFIGACAVKRKRRPHKITTQAKIGRVSVVCRLCHEKELRVGGRGTFGSLNAYRSNT